MSDAGSAATTAASTGAKRSKGTHKTPAASVSPTTKADSFVQDRIQKEGLHGVHFWTPWCQYFILFVFLPRIVD